MSHDDRPLPAGWIQQWNEQHNAPYWVDTNANPPRSIWCHPLDDPEYQRSQGGSTAFAPPPGPPPGHPSSHNNSSSSFPNDTKSPSGLGGSSHVYESHQASSSHSTQPPLDRTQSQSKKSGGLFGKIKAKIDEAKQSRPQQGYGGQGGGYGGRPGYGGGGGYGQPQYMQGGYPQQYGGGYMQPQSRFGGGMGGGRMGGGGGMNPALMLGGGLLAGGLMGGMIADGQNDAYNEGFQDGGDFDGGDMGGGE
ncbi:hypothetical protein JCM11251_000566 [Rhodosporidiobolus azoricus]